MLVDSMGDVVITNDGVTILKEIEVEHPAAKMIIETAKTQDEECRDGTTTAVVLAGEFLKRSEDLIDQNVHPTIIAGGFRMASERAVKFLEDSAEPVNPDDEEILKSIAETAMTGKGAEDSKEKFADIIVKAVKQVQDEGKVDIDDIKIEKSKGEGIKDTELISGIVLDKDKVSQDMPKKIEGAKVALIDFPVELKNPEIETKISISTPEQLQSFLHEEEKTIKEMIEKIKLSGTNVIFCQKGIDDFAQYLLAKDGIYACRRVAKSDMEKLAKATIATLLDF